MHTRHVKLITLSFLLLVMSMSCNPAARTESKVANSGFRVAPNSHLAKVTVALGTIEEPECKQDNIKNLDHENGENQTVEDSLEGDNSCQSDVSYFAFCTGIVIGQQKILTAAHCVPEVATQESLEKMAEDEGLEPGTYEIVPKSLKIYAFFGLDSSKPEHTIEVSSAYVFPKYVDTLPPDFDFYRENLYDMAAINLVSPIPTTHEPVPLPPTGDAHVPYDEYRTVWIAGYGRQGDDNWARARTNSQNGGMLNQLPTQIDKGLSRQERFNLRDSTVCHGDSGGPLVKIVADDKSSNQPRIDYLLGVASWVADPQFCSGDAFYTDVRRYLDFIENPSNFTAPRNFPLATYEIMYVEAETVDAEDEGE